MMYLVLITLLGFILRLILSNQSFWLDEAASVEIARTPMILFFEQIKSDFHPPLYYLFLNPWLSIAGNTEWFIRLPGIIIGAASIPLVYLICREVFGKKTAIPLMSALFLAINPLHIYYSQELRMYSLVTFFVLLSWLYLLRKKMISLSILNLLSIFTFYGAFLNIAGQIVYIFYKERRLIKKYLLSLIPSVLSFVFWWPIFSVQLQNGGYLKSVLSGWQVLSGSLTIKSLLLIPIKFIFGRISLDPPKLYYVLGGVLLTLFTFFIIESLKNKKNRLFVFWLFIPLILASIISIKTPMLGYWRFIFLLPPFIILTTAGIFQLPSKFVLPAIALVSMIFVAGNFVFWSNTKFHREDWRGLVDRIKNENALVVLAFPFKFVPLEIYKSNNDFLPALTPEYKINSNLSDQIKRYLGYGDKIIVLDYLADLTDPGRKIIEIVKGSDVKEISAYNVNNLGKVYVFQKY